MFPKRLKVSMAKLLKVKSQQGCGPFIRSEGLEATRGSSLFYKKVLFDINTSLYAVLFSLYCL